MMNKPSSKVVSIVLARGGSKGIPHKNVVNFCGRPLISWTIDQLSYCVESGVMDSIWVSSDDESILNTAVKLHPGIHRITRPKELSTDESTSESGWLHALDVIEQSVGPVDAVVAPQVTSPIRSPDDMVCAISAFINGEYDSMFSASHARDLCLWRWIPQEEKLTCESYDINNPNRRRQVTFGDRYIENGSFYIFRPSILRSTGLRFGGINVIYELQRWKQFEIDEPSDLKFLEMIAKNYFPSQFSGK